MNKINNVLPYDQIKINEMNNGESYIINTDPSYKDGEHWVSIIKHDNCYIFYDSFARTLYNTIPELNKKIKSCIKNINKQPDQFGSTTNCGQLTLTFLYVYYKYGYDIASQI